MKIKKNNLYVAGTFAIILVGALFLLSGSGKAVSPLTGSVIGNQNVQIVKLSVSGGNYVLEPSEVKVGIPVRLEADMNKMPGCSRSVVIPSFGVRKNLNEKDNIIEFTPDKSGTFNIACSMNMYTGTFTVVGVDGAKSNYVEQALPSGGGCGMGGGCGGCGG